MIRIKEYTPEEYHDVADEMEFDDDFEEEDNFWDRLNNLRYQLFKVKLAKLEETIEHRVGNMLIEALTIRIRLARSCGMRV